ncbi:hypothetical protein Mag101_11360 [Microbulbifer agarilyticus]|uniref:Uncharacterized protein n=1 Tax=Microbulbifer agarilyticus TaxID=260552 RepID=A0A1Q2M796_9GAMM|nr:hypothetical protein Mag101_11360 [Microbulbifer agarilyticus]
MRFGPYMITLAQGDDVMLRVIALLVFALILLALAARLFYDNKDKNETGCIEPIRFYQIS